jgi:hypothetical protein
MVFVGEALGAWLIERLAEAGTRRVGTLVLGTDRERALRDVGRQRFARRLNSCYQLILSGWFWLSGRSSPRASHIHLQISRRSWRPSSRGSKFVAWRLMAGPTVQVT